MENLPNINLFKYKSPLVGKPIQEIKDFYEESANQFASNQNAYNLLKTTLANTKGISQYDNDYLDTVNKNIEDNISKVAKDAQGNIRWETAQQAVKDLGLKYVTDQKINAIKDNYKKAEEEDVLFNTLKAQSKNPIRFNGDRSNFKSFEFDKEGKLKTNQYNAWVEPTGQYTEAYQATAHDIGYEELKKLRPIIEKGNNATTEEKQYLNDNIERMFKSSKGLGELDQDYRVLLDKFAGDENKTKEFILENRLKPAIFTKSKAENQIDMMYAKQEEAAKLEDIRQINREKLESQKEEARLRLEEAKLNGKKELLSMKNNSTNKSNSIFSDVTLPDEGSDNQYAIKPKELKFKNDGSIDTDIKNENFTSQYGVYAGTQAMEAQKKIERLKKDDAEKSKETLNDFREVDPKFKQKDVNGKYLISDKDLTNIYNNAVKDEDTVFGKTSNFTLTDDIKGEFESNFRTAGINNPQAVVKGGDETDRRKLSEKLEKDYGFNLSDTYKIDFVGIASLGNSKRDRSLDGGYTMNITQGNKSKQVIIPAPDAIRSKFKVVNDALQAGLRSKMNTAKVATKDLVDGSSLFGLKGLYLQPDKRYNTETGKLEVRYKPIWADNKGNKEKDFEESDFEKYGEKFGELLDKEYSLDDLRILSLAKVTDDPVFVNKYFSKKDMTKN